MNAPERVGGDPRVIVLAGGELLIAGAAVADVARALRLAGRTARRDGLGLSGLTRALLVGADEALRRQAVTSASGSPEVPEADDSGSWSETSGRIGTREAAEIMRITDRGVRDLCDRGSFATAARAGRDWTIDRAEVLERAERRTS